MLLVLVTLMGVSITQISSIELQVAGNDRDYKENFFMADAATMECLQRLHTADVETLRPTAKRLPWVQTSSETLENMTDMEAKGSQSTIDASGKTYYAATFEGVTGGASLAMTTTSNLYTFEAHGYSEYRGRAHIVAGYKRRF